MARLDGKVALITGAGTGIGRPQRARWRRKAQKSLSPKSTLRRASNMMIGQRLYISRCPIVDVRFARDSLLEEAGFEPSVPRKTPAVVVISGLVAPPSPLRQGEPTRAPLSKPWSSHAVLTVRSGLFQR